MSDRVLNLSSREDLAYLEACVDHAPRLASRADITDPLTDHWRRVILGLIAALRVNLPVSSGGGAADNGDNR
jgi:hypothetical protein